MGSNSQNIGERIQQRRHFPISLSDVFVGSCILGDDNISDDLMLQAFKLYEKDVINDCLKNRENLVQNIYLLDLLSSFNCYRYPNGENIESIISQLAHASRTHSETTLLEELLESNTTIAEERRYRIPEYLQNCLIS